MEEGDNLSLFGKNGSGKSTLFQMITGHLRQDSGEIILFGEKLRMDSFQLKRRMGYLPQNLDLPRWVSGFDLITYNMKLHEMNPIAERRQQILEYWDCQSFAYKPLAACSYGMQKRIALALASMHEPELLILDEPFSGLDLFHIRALENLLEQRRGHLLTVVSTHVAAYAAKLSNRAATIHSGQVRELSEWPNADFMTRIKLMEEQFFNPEVTA
jgi:ABC-type multidrug transport system ATPase subunit